MAEARTRALLRREGERLAQTMRGRFAQHQVDREGVASGRNLVAISGQIYPAEGIEGRGGAIRVVNLGTPAVARYAPAQRTSVIAAVGTGMGTGEGGGGSGSDLVAGFGISIAGGTISVNTAAIIEPTRGIGLTSSRIGVKLAATSGLAFDGTGALMVADSIAGAGLQISNKVMSVNPAIAGDGLVWDEVNGQIDINLAGNSGLQIASDLLSMGTPGTLSATSANQLTSNSHFHAIDASDNPGAATRIIKTGPTGLVTLRHMTVNQGNLQVTGNGRLWVNAGIAPDGRATTLLRAASTSVNDTTLTLHQIAGQQGQIVKIVDSDDNPLILIRNDGTLESGRVGFVSGESGWRITPTGTAEFNNVFVRGELHAVVFVKDEVHAVGGTVLIATAAKLIEPEAVTGDRLHIRTTAVGGNEDTKYLRLRTTAVGNPGDTRLLNVRVPVFALDVEDPPSGHAELFQPGEILRIQTEYSNGVTGAWLEVLRSDDLGTHYRYIARRVSGTGDSFPAGAAVVSYGQPGDGRILLTSDLNESPYLSVFTTPADPWNGLVSHVRLGKLNGLGLPEITPSEPEWGLAAGSRLNQPATSPYFIISDRRAVFKRINLEMDNGTFKTAQLTAGGEFRLGTNVEGAQGSGIGFRFDPATGNLYIGNPAGGQGITWDQAAGLLSVAGVVNLPDPDISWDDITGKPLRFSFDNNPVGQAPGLYITSGFLGFWNGSSFRSYIDSAGNLSAGNYQGGGQGLFWDQSAGTLSIRGTIQVSGGNAATQSYADSAAGAAETNAKNYADTVSAIAQSIAEAYARKRRVVAVQGSWTKGQGTLSWSGVVVTFADGSQIAVNNSAVSVPAPRILLVNVVGGSPQNLSVQPTSYIPPSDGNMVVIGKVTPGGAGENVSLEIFGGETSIGPGWIQTGAITADKINVTSLSAIRTETGTLDLSGRLVFRDQNTSVITTGTINSPSDFSNAGMYLGWDESPESAGIGGDPGGIGIQEYKMRFAGSQTSLVYNGISLALRTSAGSNARPLRIRSSVPGGFPAILFEISTDNSFSQAAKIWRSGSEKALSIEGNLTSFGGTFNISGWNQISAATLSASSTVSSPTVSTGHLSLTTPGNITNLAPGWNGGGFVIGSGFSAQYIRYCKIGNVVILQGAVDRGANFETLIADVPAEIIPSTMAQAPAYASGNSCFVTLETDGDLILSGAPGGNALTVIFQLVYTLT